MSRECPARNGGKCSWESCDVDNSCLQEWCDKEHDGIYQWAQDLYLTLKGGIGRYNGTETDSLIEQGLAHGFIKDDGTEVTGT